VRAGIIVDVEATPAWETAKFNATRTMILRQPGTAWLRGVKHRQHKSKRRAVSALSVGPAYICLHFPPQGWRSSDVNRCFS
jgi:hypothetical protein